MKEDSALPFPRGETFYGGNTALMAADLAQYGQYGGFNYEGKEYVFELNSPDDTAMTFLDGRSVRARLVRNSSGAALKPGRVIHAKAEVPLGGHTDGYCYQLADLPLGVVDEFLPSAGVAANDLFWCIIDGPTKFTNKATPATTAIGSILVPAATGSTRTDDLAGRVDLQDLTGATATLGNNVQNVVGFAEAIDSTASDLFIGIVARAFKF